MEMTGSVSQRTIVRVRRYAADRRNQRVAQTYMRKLTESLKRVTMGAEALVRMCRAWAKTFS